MGARQLMRHRAHVQRDANRATEDPYGGTLPPNWQTHLAALPCHTWFEADRQVVDGQKTAVIEERKVIVPRGSDVGEGDRILDIRDRLGGVVFSGPALIESAGNRRDHIALVLEEVS